MGKSLCVVENIFNVGISAISLALRVVLFFIVVAELVGLIGVAPYGLKN